MVSEDVFHQRGIILLYRTFNLIIQSLLYGVYASLIPISTYIMIEKGLHSRSQKILFGVIVFMFSLSTAYLVVSMVDLTILIKTWYLVLDLSESTDTRSPTEPLLLMFNALAPINYALTDGVVVWRAWIICRDEFRKLLRVPIAMLVFTMFGVVATIGRRAFVNVEPFKDNGPFASALDFFQEITLVSSLITNILGTGVIALKAWRYRRWIVADLQRVVNKRTKAERVLGLLVESGVFYIFSGAMMAVSSFIRLPNSHLELGSLYSQTAVHLAGIYPLIVVILVNREATMDKALFNSTLPIIITDLQQASSHARASQTAAGQPKSAPIASLQFTAEDESGPPHSSLDSSSPRDSLASVSSLAPDVDPEILLESGGGVDHSCENETGIDKTGG